VGRGGSVTILVVEEAYWERVTVLHDRLVPREAVKALGGVPRVVRVKEIVETRVLEVLQGILRLWDDLKRARGSTAVGSLKHVTLERGSILLRSQSIGLDINVPPRFRD